MLRIRLTALLTCSVRAEEGSGAGSFRNPRCILLGEDFAHMMIMGGTHQTETDVLVIDLQRNKYNKIKHIKD